MCRAGPRGAAASRRPARRVKSPKPAKESIRVRTYAYVWTSVGDSPIQSPDHESRDLERQRNPRPPRAISAVGGGGTTRGDLPAGDQGEARSDPAKLFD